MPTHYTETDGDRAAWARLWGLVRQPWERTEDLARVLGVARTTIAEWCPPGRNAGAGPWTLLRAALRETARRYPEAVPALVESLAGELFDARGRWIPEGDDAGGTWAEESADVTVAHAHLVEAVREGDPVKIRQRARELIRETAEAAAAAARAA